MSSAYVDPLIVSLPYTFVKQNHWNHSTLECSLGDRYSYFHTSHSSVVEWNVTLWPKLKWEISTCSRVELDECNLGFCHPSWSAISPMPGMICPWLHMAWSSLGLLAWSIPKLTTDQRWLILHPCNDPSNDRVFESPLWSRTTHLISIYLDSRNVEVWWCSVRHTFGFTPYPFRFERLSSLNSLYWSYFIRWRSSHRTDLT